MKGLIMHNEDPNIYFLNKSKWLKYFKNIICYNDKKFIMIEKTINDKLSKFGKDKRRFLFAMVISDCMLSFKPSSVKYFLLPVSVYEQIDSLFFGSIKSSNNKISLFLVGRY